MSAQEDLDYAKSLCLEGESESEHAMHADQLTRAYVAFANQDEKDSNPAAPETSITAAVVATSEDLERRA